MRRSNAIRPLCTRRGHEWGISAIFKALLQIRPLVPLVPSSAHRADGRARPQRSGHDCAGAGRISYR